MKRDKMITRTVTATIVKVLGVNTVTAQAVQETFTMTGTYKTNAELLKAVKEQHDGENVYAAVISTETKDTLYGMPESLFMQYATELPPRKVYEQ